MATLVVNSTADGVDLNPGDGVCEISAGGSCTLRAAIQEANAFGSPSEQDRIDLPAGTYNLSIAGSGIAAGDLDIFQSLLIQGAGSNATIIDGNAIDRVFDVGSGSVEIRGVTIRGGKVDDTEALLEGSGGGIRNEGSLTLADSVVTGNLATLGAGVGNYNGTLLIERSVITGNGDSATLGGGGISNHSYYDPASVSISDSTVSENNANEGGGIRNYAYDGVANFTVSRSTISGNTARTGGGLFNRGFYYFEENVAANLTLNSSTISGNVAGTTGGGVHSEAIDGSDSVITINSSTIAENSASGGEGGGLFVLETSGTVTSLRSVIVASNDSKGVAEDIFGSDVIASFSLIGDADGHGILNGVGSNLVGIDAMLLPLGDNGGPTLTHALAAGSPAIDQGTSNGFIGDQRGSGFLRTFDDPALTNSDDGTDIGSIEVGQIGAAFDFGDAPDHVLVGNTLRRYPTLMQSNGARHRVVDTGPKLGAVEPDPEFDAIPSITASGDDLIGFDDEDSLGTTPIVLNPGETISGLSISHDGGDTGALLNVWVDLNLDGDWEDQGEQLLVDVSVPSGSGSTSLDGILIPSNATPGTTFIRTRISTQAGLTSSGAASDGEVEDFLASIGPPPSAVADLELSNIVSNANPGQGEQVVFTLTLTNEGPDRASGVSVSALLPFDLSLDDFQVSQGAYNAASGVWSVGAVKPFETAQLLITVTVDTTDTVNFTAEITESDASDPDSTPGNGLSGEDDQGTAAIGTCLVGRPIHVGINRLTYVCASPGAFTAFVQGTQRGSFTFEQYRTTVDIGDAKEIAIGIADANGVAEALFSVSENDVSGSFLFQAFEMFPRRHITNTLSLNASSEQLRASSVGPGATPIQRDVIDSSVAQALRLWRSAGLSPNEMARLHSATIVVSELPGDIIARVVGRTIVVDSDAAGHGWFIDSTPWESSEFSSGPLLRTAVADTAIGRMDLLTTLTHEFGHVLGLDDVTDPTHIMNATLATGLRRLPAPNQNLVRRFDVNGDQRVTSLDALLVINQLNQASADTGSDTTLWIGDANAYYDTSGDYRLSALDALLIVNHLRDERGAEGESPSAFARRATDVVRINNSQSVNRDTTASNRAMERISSFDTGIRQSLRTRSSTELPIKFPVEAAQSLPGLDQIIELLASDKSRDVPTETQ